ncbi:MAG: hypothetical protein GY788_29510 [bacterium]|nr:hypothetical protein [bacterium]
MAAIWLVVALQAFLILLIYRQIDRAYGLGALGRLKQLEPGVKVPPLFTHRRDGTDYDYEFPVDDTLTVLFISPTCTSCFSLMVEISEEPERIAGDLLVGVTPGQAAPRMHRLLHQDVVQIVSIPDIVEVSRDWALQDVPAAYVIHRRRVASSGLASSIDELNAVRSQGDTWAAENALGVE